MKVRGDLADRKRRDVIPAQPGLGPRLRRSEYPQVPGLRVEDGDRAVMEHRQGPRYVLAWRQRRPLTSRLAACGAAVSARPALVVSHLLLRPGCQQTLHALATFARTSFGLHHIP